jgi:hypothetical protein
VFKKAGVKPPNPHDNPIFDIILGNIKKRGGTSSFKCSRRRTGGPLADKSTSTGGGRSKQRGGGEVPAVGFYECRREALEPKAKNVELDLSKGLGRHERTDKD